MQTMTGKEVLRAIADGADPSEFEWFSNGHNYWKQFDGHQWTILSLKNCKAEFRRKPRTRVVNGFTVPAPIRQMPENNTEYWMADPSWGQWCFCFVFDSHPEKHYAYERGLLFDTEKAAIANAKAMCGIDPMYS